MAPLLRIFRIASCLGVAICTLLAAANQAAARTPAGRHGANDSPVTTQLKNTGQPSYFRYPLNSTIARHGQAFTTGPNPGGYVLSSIGIHLTFADTSQAAGSITVTVNPVGDDGEPGDALCTLGDPGTFTASGVQTFTADSSCPTLAADTTYAAVVLRDDGATTAVEWGSTTSTEEDTLDPATGWTIAHPSIYRSDNNGGLAWSDFNRQSLIEVRGAAAISTLVKNTDQPTGEAVAITSRGKFLAQQFNTGPTGRYTLGSIGVRFSHLSPLSRPAETITATLNRSVRSGGTDRPGTRLCTLTNPATFPSSGVIFFAAPADILDACPELSGDTEYFVVVRYSGSTNVPHAHKTYSDAEDALTPATGWTIADGSPRRIEVTGAVAQVSTPGAPTITGAARIRETLTASTGGVTDPDGLTDARDNDDFTYQWIRVDGGTESGIAGATSDSYQLTDDDVGKRIKVRVSFTDDANNAESRTSDASDTVAGVPPNRHSTGVPSIDATLLESGQALTADTSDVSDPDTVADRRTNSAFAYQWIRVDGDTGEQSDIAGATSRSYELTDADVGTRIRVKVSFTDSRDHDETATSDATGTILTANQAVTGAPTISGWPRIGGTLAAHTDGVADPDGLDNATLEYQWVRAVWKKYHGYRDVDIPGATNSTYTLTDDDTGEKFGNSTRGHRVRVRVRLTDDASHAETVVSSHTSRAGDRWSPTIGGTLRAGETLTANLSHNDVWQAHRVIAPTLTYQWIRTIDHDRFDSRLWIRFPASDASGHTYTLNSRDAGERIKVRVSFSDDNGNPVSMESTYTGVVAPAVNPDESPATGTPTIFGTPHVGETLTADVSGIADADGLTNPGYVYQWIRFTEDDDQQNWAYSNIRAYNYHQVTNDDAGSKMQVRVYFTDDAGFPQRLTSATTGTVTGGRDNAVGRPVITGTREVHLKYGNKFVAEVGDTLTATTDDISDPDGMTTARGDDSFTYQWIRRNTSQTSIFFAVEYPIPGATSSTYTVAAADVDYEIRVRVGFVDDGGNSEWVVSRMVECRGGSGVTIVTNSDNSFNSDNSYFRSDFVPLDPQQLRAEFDVGGPDGPGGDVGGDVGGSGGDVDGDDGGDDGGPGGDVGGDVGGSGGDVDGDDGGPGGDVGGDVGGPGGGDGGGDGGSGGGGGDGGDTVTLLRDYFVDDDGSTHEANINKIAAAGITVGCNPPDSNRYCPLEPVTRAQMASFLARALDLPDTDTDYFVDDDGSTHEANINKIAAAGITVGCNPPDSNRYCPLEPVTRAQMASFLARALDLPDTDTDYFVDDDGSIHEANINKIAAAGITVGCNPPDSNRYCPLEPVIRAQMASFLARALNLP